MINCYGRFANIWSFLVVFCICFFVETITFTYLISAIQSIERQFQIPSKLSGALVSAGDIGYVLTVVALSYFGSKGNRARWIGGGCILISLACLLISLPYFIFPATSSPMSNFSVVKEIAKPPAHLLGPNVSVEDVLEYPPIKKMVPHTFREVILRKAAEEAGRTYVPEEEADKNALSTFIGGGDYDEYYDNLQEEKMEKNSGRKRRQALSGMIDPETEEKFKEIGMKLMFDDKNVTTHDLLILVQKVLSRGYPDEMLIKMQRAAGMPVGHCNAIINSLKQKVQDMKCEIDQTNELAFAMVFLGIMFIGVGHSMPWSLGVPLIDDNVKKRSTPFYFAGVFFIRILGPICGFLMGGACNRLYFNFKPPEGLSPTDPRWIGSWWLGFLVVAGALFLPSILLFCFPSSVATVKTHQKSSRAGRNRAIGENGAQAEEERMDPKLKNRQNIPGGRPDQHKEESRGLLNEGRHFIQALAQVLRSPIYTGALIGRLFDALAFKGFFVFLPKYLESHFGLPQFKANLYLAVMGVVGFAIGVAAGSAIMKKFKLEGRRAALYVGLCSLISGVISFGKIGLGCHSVVNMVGRDAMATNFNFTAPCNMDCFCEPVKVFPVCSKAGTPYYSPCVAGCRTMKMDMASKKMDISDCDCIDEGTTVSREWCEDDCWTPLMVYFSLMVITGLIGGTSVIPGILIVLRSVPTQYRSVALGFSGFAISLISTFPSPIVYGLLIDSACLLWNTDCGKKGSCTLYEPNALRYRMHGFNGALRMFAMLFDVWVWYWAKDLKLMTESKPNSEVEEEDEREMVRKLTLTVDPPEIAGKT